jgi:hypothetical protein
MRFEKGESGNPAGRPPGSHNKATILAESIFEGEAESIIRMAIDKARADLRESVAELMLGTPDLKGSQRSFTKPDQ